MRLREMIVERCKEIVKERKDRREAFEAWLDEIYAAFEGVELGGYGKFVRAIDSFGHKCLCLTRFKLPRPEEVCVDGVPKALYLNGCDLWLFETDEGHHVSVPLAFLPSNDQRSYRMNNLDEITEKLSRTFAGVLV